MRTLFAKKDEFPRKWYVVDAEGQVLGRLATRIASYLRGKHKPQFTPNADTGDFIVVINAGKVRLTGNKMDKKIFYRHSNYPGGLKSETARERHTKKPTALIEGAVRGMLPKTRLGRKQLKKLKVYSGSAHPHEAQRPEPLFSK